MATHRISILGGSVVPDATGEVFPEPYSILATNDVWRNLVWRFGISNAAQPTVRHGIYGQFQVPKNYIGSAVLKIIWTATVTTGDVAWDFEYRAVGGNDVESLDQAGTQESVTVTDTAASAANERLEASVTLTATNFAVDDTVTFFFARDGADAADTMAAAGLLFDLMLEYADA